MGGSRYVEWHYSCNRCLEKRRQLWSKRNELFCLPSGSIVRVGNPFFFGQLIKQVSGRSHGNQGADYLHGSGDIAPPFRAVRNYKRGTQRDDAAEDGTNQSLPFI